MKQSPVPSRSPSQDKNQRYTKPLRKRPMSRSPEQEEVNKYPIGSSTHKTSKFTIQPGVQSLAKQPPTQNGIQVERIQPHLQKAYKFAMRILVGNLPYGFDKDKLASFLYKAIPATQYLLHANQIISSNFKHQSKHVFLTLRSIEQTTQCLQLDGIFFMNKALKLKRPTEYETETKNRRVEGTRILPKMDLSKVKICRVGSNFHNTFNKLYFSNFPPDFQEQQTLDELSTYGKMRAFQLTVDRQTNRSTGSGHVEYQTNQHTDNCLRNLHNKNIQGNTISVKRAVLVGAHDQQQPAQLGNPISITPSVPRQSVFTSVKKPSMFQKDQQSRYALLDIQTYFKDLKISCVLKLWNIIPRGVDAEVIKKDLLSQLERVGKIVKVAHKQLHVWVQYQKVQYAQIAYILLLTHKYDGKLVQISFFDPISFADNLY